MGACSSVEVIDSHRSRVMHPLPTPPTLHKSVSQPLPSSPAIAHQSPSLLPLSPTPQSPDSHPSLSPIDRPNRHSSSALSTSSPSLRLNSLTLDTEPLDSPPLPPSPPQAPHTLPPSPVKPSDANLVQVREAPSDSPPSLYRNDVSPTHAAPRTRTALNPRRQKAAEVETPVTSETQPQSPADVVEAKRASRTHSLFAKINRTSNSSRSGKKPLHYDVGGDEKRLTADGSVPIQVLAAGVSTIPPPDVKRLSALFPGLKGDKGDLLLPPAPAIPTTRLPSENGILDVIRVLGQAQAVSATTLSQYTRCVPATLAGPLPRSPRGSWQGEKGAWGGVGCCAKLHCERCHMDVMMLDHHRWVGGVGEGVFREAYPEVQRLRGSLVASVGSRAYCCACNWTDVKGPVTVEEAVEEDRALHWACAGHQ